MGKDYDLLVYKLPYSQEKVNIWPVGDTQIGSANFDKQLWYNWVREVLKDPYAKVVIVGDMVNNALKNSKSDSYGDIMRPREAKLWLKEALKPIAHLLIGAVKGNHEERSGSLTDDCPLYDVLSKLDLEDIYRENFCFIKINVGQKHAKKQVSYTLALAHGVSKGKTENFGYAIDGMDMFFTGHIHQPMNTFPAKLVIDSHNEKVSMKGFKHIIVPSFDKLGGYTLRGMYMPQDSTVTPIAECSGKYKKVDIRWKQL